MDFSYNEYNDVVILKETGRISIASVAKRLGHASMTTTQRTYLHIIHELENKDIDLVMRAISSL